MASRNKNKSKTMRNPSPVLGGFASSRAALRQQQQAIAANQQAIAANQQAIAANQQAHYVAVSGAPQGRRLELQGCQLTDPLNRPPGLGALIPTGPTIQSYSWPATYLDEAEDEPPAPPEPEPNPEPQEALDPARYPDEWN